MDVKLFRIDERLIHGQVITGWLRVTGAKRILILDDDVAKDELSLQLFKMASPPGVSVEARSLEDGVKLLKEGEDIPSIVLFRTPIEAKAVHDAGIEMSNLNLGGIGNKPGRKHYNRNVNLSPEEEAALKELSQSGVKIEVRMVPDYKAQKLEDIIK